MNTKQGAMLRAGHQCRPLDRAEILVGCLAWPGVAGVCSLLLYWLWIDPDGRPVGLMTIAASAVFLVLQLAAMFCSAQAWLEFLTAFRRAPPAGRGPDQPIDPGPIGVQRVSPDPSKSDDPPYVMAELLR